MQKASKLLDCHFEQIYYKITHRYISVKTIKAYELSGYSNFSN